MLEVAPGQVDEFLANLETNCRRKLPQFEPSKQRKGTFVLVGGGPSLNRQEKAIRALWEQPDTRVVALNSAVDWLCQRKMRPHGCIMMEIAPWPEEMDLRPQKRVTYYLASFASPDTHDRLKGQIVQFHIEDEVGGAAVIRKHIRDPFIIHGGSNSAMTALPLGLWMGFRDFEAFGVDCSFIEQSHAYRHVEEHKYQESRIDVDLGRRFNTTQVLWRQAREMIEFCYHNRGLFKLRIHGDGLLPHAHRLYFSEEYA